LNWNLLYAFPGDSADAYARTLDLIPLLRHLVPPSDLCRLSIDRFSPYHNDYRRYGIRSIEPMPSYRSVLPDHADIPRIAYHFLGDYDSGILEDVDLIRRLSAAIGDWRAAWNNDAKPPMLAIVALADDTFTLMDTRGLPGVRSIRFLDTRESAAALLPHPMSRDDAYGEDARERLLAVEYEGWHVPLATASAEVLSAFEKGVSAATPVPPPELVQIGDGSLLAQTTPAA
jgi:hypothetical protein